MPARGRAPGRPLRERFQDKSGKQGAHRVQHSEGDRDDGAGRLVHRFRRDPRGEHLLLDEGDDENEHGLHPDPREPVGQVDPPQLAPVGGPGDSGVGGCGDIRQDARLLDEEWGKHGEQQHEDGTFREAWRRRWRVFAGLGATWLLLLFLVRSTHGRNGSFGVGSGVSWWSYALAQFPAIAHYLRLSVWPHPLTFDYGTQWVTGLWAVLPYALLVVALIAATTWALLCPGMGCKALGFAGAWFFAILAPTSLMPGNRQTAAEHRMYLALIPLVLLAVVGLHRRLGRATLPVCVGS